MSVFRKVDFHCVKNNSAHHTIEISRSKLTVRRGQSFNMTLELREAFNPLSDPLKLTASTGSYPSEETGTMSVFGVPDNLSSPHAKAAWKAELQESYSLQTGIVNLTITPPADAPIGQYIVMVRYKNVETLLGELTVLYNPWCSDDWVFLPSEDERQEYVMNESGILYRGSGNYISPCRWDFGQFEDRMVDICIMLLDLNPKYNKDPSDDISARCNPIYVSRVVSAMINSEDDHGVLQGRWSGSYAGGVPPTHWTGSYTILRQWFFNFRPVKYGQCWVFAAVMCSVMRLLGIPCRVVTNFQSAHDRNQNLTIDVYHADYGVRERPSTDSVWNFHVWVEAWMRRPDLAEDGRYDGWQVLDPTPQEKSDGVYCCGPAPVKAILKGETHLKYDIPFVFAEVNADCVDWLVRADGSKMKIWTDSKRVGQNISTKGVGTFDRMIITNNYKYKEGSSKERAVFKYACTRDLSSDSFEAPPLMMMSEMRGGPEEMPHSAPITVNDESTMDNDGMPSSCIDLSVPQIPPLTIQFEEVSIPTVGADVSMNLLLKSPPETTDDKSLSITISIQCMTYNCESSVSMKQEVKEEKLLAGKDLSIPILIPFEDYRKHLLDCDTIKVSAMVSDKEKPEDVYYAEEDIVLQDPPISITVSGHPKQNAESSAQVIFKNPINETLTGCCLTVSGSGLFKEEVEYKTPDMKPNTRILVTFYFTPYKSGKKTLMVNFGCSIFRDISGSCTVDVQPSKEALDILAV